jgi:hypothetical protein
MLCTFPTSMSHNQSCTPVSTPFLPFSPCAGKTTLLRALAAHEIPGIPPQCQILHVEQEVVGDDTSVLEVS